MNFIEAVPDSNESMIKTFLIFSIDYHIKHVDISEKDKIELLILKKFFIISSLKTIVKRINIKVNYDDKLNDLELTFTDELKQYINIEYKKYIKNDKKLC